MSKRKRSLEAPTSSDPAHTTGLSAYQENGFTHQTLAHADHGLTRTISNDYTAPEVSGEHDSIDGRLHCATSLTASAEDSWKSHHAPRNFDASNNHADMLRGITRKITACTACRKQKIKCEMPKDVPPCIRCERRGIACVLNKSLQTLLEDTSQAEHLRTDIHNLHETLDVVCQKLGIPTPRPLITARSSKTNGQDTGAVSTDNDQECEVSPPTSPSAVQAPIDTFLEVAKLGSPTSADTPQGTRHPPRPLQAQDLITKAVLSLSVAEALCHRYFSRLDHFLYGIGSNFPDLPSLRQSSPVLVAAICTVSALHDPKAQSIYESCNREFRRLVSRAVFEKRGVDHLQALCIGSFWLTDASRILSSDALRRAADVRLHRHFQFLLDSEGGPHQSSSSLSLSRSDHTDRVRLWYLLFICDQHLSILHNRDPLLRTDKEILANWEFFLERDGVTDSDSRLMSQVALLLIMGQVRDTFGSELDDRVAKGLSAQIMNFSKQLDKWYNKFAKVFKPNPHIGDFPMKGLQMHYQFGKLYLGHHVFKGLKGDPIPPHFLSAASLARDATIEIFDMILRDKELQESLVGMPHYFHIMIAFAGHFLMEICTKYHEQLSLDVSHSLGLIGGVLTLFQKLPCIPQHPISRMSGGLSQKLMESTTAMTSAFGGELQDLNVHQRGLMNQQPIMDVVNQFIPPLMPSDNNASDFDHHHHRSYPELRVGANDFIFADFEQFSFPDMTMNFTT
ncbi:hypothetical protein LTS17_006581 [Exophiala oligosperma]